MTHFLSKLVRVVRHPVTCFAEHLAKEIRAAQARVVAGRRAIIAGCARISDNPKAYAKRTPAGHIPAKGNCYGFRVEKVVGGAILTPVIEGEAKANV